MAELKPCPFCGGTDIGMNKRTEDHFVRRSGEFKMQTKSERYQIKCRECPCETYYGFYLEDVIEAWNRRAEDGK